MWTWFVSNATLCARFSTKEGTKFWDMSISQNGWSIMNGLIPMLCSVPLKPKITRLLGNIGKKRKNQKQAMLCFKNGCSGLQKNNF